MKYYNFISDFLKVGSVESIISVVAMDTSCLQDFRFVYVLQAGKMSPQNSGCFCIAGGCSSDRSDFLGRSVDLLPNFNPDFGFSEMLRYIA